jgi:uncharacterized protein (DUF58 family)
VKKLREIEIAAKKSVLDLFSGMYRSTFKGQGIELDDIREYVYGDDPRSISWNKTAQLGRPFVKTFTEERDLTVLVMVDISHSTDFSSTLITKYGRSCCHHSLLSNCKS